MRKPKVLVVDDDPDILEILELTLENDYQVLTATDGEQALEKIKNERPDLVILDYNIPKKDGIQVCKEVKEDVLLRHIPILILTGKGETHEKVKGLDSGADDYIVKPFNPTELLARIRMALRRTTRDLDANPLTLLPGNVSIYNEIQKRINNKEIFAVCYLDLDKFKSYNDKYGFEAGDRVIKETARIIIEAVQEKGTEKDFVGHIGGDDFVIITVPQRAEKICKKIIEDFDRKAPFFYDEEARKSGFIIAKDRQGNIQKIPLLSISIGIVTNEFRKFSHVGEIAQIGAELKSYAKRLPGSNFVKDKRKGE